MRHLRFLRIAYLGLIVFMGGPEIAVGQGVTLSVGTGSGAAGGSVAVPINLMSSGGAQTAAVQWSLSYSSDITGVTFTAGTAATNAGKSIVCNANLCMIYGMNAAPIPDGTVATATFQISSNPSTLTIPIQIAGVVAATPAGDSIPAAGNPGTILVPQAPALNGLVCSPTTLNTPGTTQCTISLTSPAPAGGLVVPLSSSNVNLTVPSTATVNAGQSTASFMAAAAQVVADQAATVTAGSGGSTQSVTLNLVAAVGLNSLACTPTDLSSGATSTCTASLDKPVVNTTVVSVGSNNVLLSVPGSVSVSPGQNSVTFQIVAGTVSVNQTALVTASLNGQNRSATLNLGTGPIPTADSVSPSGGGGFRQTFTFVFSDSQSATNLAAAAILLAPGLVAENSCFVVYDRNRETFQLEWDDVTGNESKPVGSSAVLQNSQCLIGAASVTATALSTSITLDITFKSAFTGLKNIYMYGADGDGSINTGWVQRGTYTVAVLPPPVPTADSVSPDGGSGFRQTFTFVFSDSQSATNMAAAAIVFAATLEPQNSCFVVYDRNRGTFQLEWDDVMGNESKSVGSSTALQNSQCLIGAVSVSATALSTTITMDITFKSAFNGLKNIYMYGANGDGSINTGWVQKGVYAVAVLSPPVPTADSVSPSGSGGASQTFTFVFSDSQSATNLAAAAMLFASSLSAPNSCFVVYDRNRGTIQLEWDDVMGNENAPVGSSTSLQNSQCVIGATSVAATAFATTITLDVTFKNAFTGLKNIYMYGADGDGSINTGWVQKGTWITNP